MNINSGLLEELNKLTSGMKMNIKIKSSLLLPFFSLVATLSPLHAADTQPLPQQRTQFVNNELWPDDKGVHINAHGGGVLYHGGAYYWFGEHKVAGDAGNKAQVGVHCYRSTDLYNWTDAGIALPVSADPASDIVQGSIIERPKVTYNAATKKFVMWFHLEMKGRGYSAARAAVAVADQPAGPYTYLRSFRANPGVWPQNVTDADKIPDKKNLLQRDFEGGQMSRDMTLFVDEDGKAYHITSAEDNRTLHIHELSADYLGYSGRYSRIFPGDSNEAPAICKYKGRYWMITSGCSGWAPNTARSAVADSIWGPWKKLPNPCTGGEAVNGVGYNKTWGGQSTFILPVSGKEGAFIALFDVWRPKDAIDGRYMWVPIQFGPDDFKTPWQDTWDLSSFK
ncbi:MAG: glycoside hydrolase family 43 protein [Terrimicrobiaceae bacterium]